jgi:hypothetical protein
MALKRFFRDCHLRKHFDWSFEHRLKVRSYHSECGMRDPAHLCQSDRESMRFFSLL